MRASRHTKVRKIIEPFVTILARFISALTRDPESQDMHIKLDRIESALKEIDLALKEDGTRTVRPSAG